MSKTFLGPAQIWKRIVAFLIDMLLINVFVIMSFSPYILKAINPNTYEINPGFGGLFLAIGLLILAYFSILEYLIAQTPGKILMNLYVISLDGKLLTMKQTILRSLFLVPIFPFYYLITMDPIFMLFNKNFQRLTEFFGKTIIIQQYNIGDIK